MNDVNFIGLKLENKYYNQLLNIVKNELFEFINIPKCVEEGLTSGVEPESHITIDYNKTLMKGPNWYNWFMFIKNSELFNEIRENPIISVNDVVIDVFNRGTKDFMVLKFNMTGCNHINTLRELHDKIEETALQPNEYNGYNPHLTLTYLLKETPMDKIDNLKNKIILSNYLNWDITKLMISGTEKYEFDI